MKCVICGEPIREKRLCPECEREVDERMDRVVEDYPSWFRLGKRAR